MTKELLKGSNLFFLTVRESYCPLMRLPIPKPPLKKSATTPTQGHNLVFVEIAISEHSCELVSIIIGKSA